MGILCVRSYNNRLDMIVENVWTFSPVGYQLKAGSAGFKPAI